MIREKAREPSTSKSRGRSCRVPCSLGCGGFTVSLNAVAKATCSSCKEERARLEIERARKRADAARGFGPDVVVHQFKVEAKKLGAS